MKIIKSGNFTVFSLLFVVQLYGIANAQSVTTAIAKNQYSDSNGYFKIFPPLDWQIQKYPQDPRGKVAFIGPEGVQLRVLAKGLDHSSFERMLEEIRAIEKQIGTSTNIEKVMFSGIPAVRRTFTLKGMKILFIDFMIGNITHNLMYSASPKQFDKYLSLAQKSMDTYEPSLNGVSPEDVKRHAIARSLRLSQVFYEQRNFDLSLEFIDEGLQIEPNNPNLLDLKEKVLGLKDSTTNMIGGENKENADGVKDEKPQDMNNPTQENEIQQKSSETSDDGVLSFIGGLFALAMFFMFFKRLFGSAKN